MDFKTELKERTKGLHDEIEATPIAKAMANSKVSVGAYASYLQGLLGIHKELEGFAKSHRSKWEVYGIDINDRCRASMIEQDLKILGYANDSKSHLVCDDWSFAKLVGGMYVLEGSTMGGVVLSQRLSYIKGSQGNSATNYFDGHRDATMHKWMHFSGFINKYVQENIVAKDDVLDGAIEVYRAVQRCMNEVKIG